MIKNIRKFLSKLMVAIMFACVSVPAFSATNLLDGTVAGIGDYGAFTTEENRRVFVDNLVGNDGDLIAFQSAFQEQIVHDYVPVEARVGIAMMNGLNTVAKILDTYGDIYYRDVRFLDNARSVQYDDHRQQCSKTCQRNH